MPIRTGEWQMKVFVVVMMAVWALVAIIAFTAKER